MFRRRALLILAFVGLPGLAAPAGAWTPETSRYVAENAARLMPTTLRAILYTHRESLFAGAMRPGSDEGAPEHQIGKGTSDLRTRIRDQADLVSRMLEHRAPLRDVAREMGVLSHFIADAENPLNLSDADPREGEYALDYSRYVESNLRKFPLVFTGYHDTDLDRGDVAAFVDAIVARASRQYSRIGQDYIRQGHLVSSEVFDEFSFAFGIGALATSNAVGDTAKIWLHLWKEAGGEEDGLPYANGAPPAAPPARAASSGR